MRRTTAGTIFLTLTLLCFFGTQVVVAATPSSFSIAQSLYATSSVPGNAYAAGATVVLTAPVKGDLSAVGGSIITAAPVGGDGLLMGGSIQSRSMVEGDLRAAGGSVAIEEPVVGDVVAFGYSVNVGSHAGGSVFIAAVNASVDAGADGPVTIYGNNVALAGTYGGDVRVVASGRVLLAASTTIRGKLSYESPEHAVIPSTATIHGSVVYKNASYLPNIGTSRVLTLINLGFFLLVRILGALILAGLLAGLFPRLASAVVLRAEARRVRSILLTTLLGFGIVVAAPILLVVLALTFVGIGVALLLFLAYSLLMMLGLLYAGILVGCLLARRFAARDTVLWRDGVVGMLILSIVTLVPVVGPIIVLFVTMFTTGALLQIFFSFAFPHDEALVEEHP